MFGGLILLLFAALAALFMLVCLAAYYLFSNQYSSISLIIPAITFSSIIIYSLVKESGEKRLMILGFLGVPFAYLGAINDLDSNKFSRHLFIITGIITNYFVLFGIINFIHSIIGKIAVHI